MTEPWLLNFGLAYDSGFQDGPQVSPVMPATLAWCFGVGAEKQLGKTGVVPARSATDSTGVQLAEWWIPCPTKPRVSADVPGAALITTQGCEGFAIANQLRPSSRFARTTTSVIVSCRPGNSIRLPVSLRGSVAGLSPAPVV
jgi:hypothetical protein